MCSCGFSLRPEAHEVRDNRALGQGCLHRDSIEFPGPISGHFHRAPIPISAQNSSLLLSLFVALRTAQQAKLLCQEKDGGHLETDSHPTSADQDSKTKTCIHSERDGRDECPKHSRMQRW